MVTLTKAFQDMLDEIPTISAAKFQTIEEILHDDKTALNFLNLILNNRNIIKDSSKRNKYGLTQARSRHSVITMLTGLYIRKFKNIDSKVDMCLNLSSGNIKDINMPYLDYFLWIIIALNHDAGYYSKNIKIKNYPLKESNYKYYLFDDAKDFGFNPLKNYSIYHNHVLLSTYDTMEHYYKYSQYFHNNKENEGITQFEKNDHGILGAVETYDKILKRNIKTNKCIPNKSRISLHYIDHEFCKADILLYKTACLTIAQHNIFKSPEPQIDEIYKKFELDTLFSTSSYKVSLNYPLLYLLSIVDTIETIKVLSKKVNDKRYAQTLTILNKTSIECSNDYIILDFSELYKYLVTEKKNYELIDSFVHHINNILSMSKWMDINVSTNFNTSNLSCIIKLT